MTKMGANCLTPEEPQAALTAILRHHLATTQLQNPQYSMRAFSKKSGVSAPVVSMILSGKRRLTYPLALKLLSPLRDNPRLKSRSKIETLLTQLKMQDRRPAPRLLSLPSDARGTVTAPFVPLCEDELALLKGWPLLTILSLVETSNFDGTSAQISSRLGLSKSQTIVAVETLLRLGLVSQTRQGKIKPTKKQFSAQSKVPSPVIQSYHRQALALARRALRKVPVQQREFSTNSLAIDPIHLPAIKEELIHFRRALTRKYEALGKKEVYRLNLQFFPMTQGPLPEPETPLKSEAP